MGGEAAGAADSLALALKALDRKERTVAELGSWLRAHGVGGEDAADVIDHLVCSGVLDDARYARRYAEDKRELKRWGSERIRAALLARGIRAEDIEAALGDGDPEPELDRATALLRERGAALENAGDRQRALGLLVRRGYDSEVAYEAIRRGRRE